MLSKRGEVGFGFLVFHCPTLLLIVSVQGDVLAQGTTSAGLWDQPRGAKAGRGALGGVPKEGSGKKEDGRREVGCVDAFFLGGEERSDCFVWGVGGGIFFFFFWGGGREVGLFCLGGGGREGNVYVFCFFLGGGREVGLFCLRGGGRECVCSFFFFGGGEERSDCFVCGVGGGNVFFFGGGGREVGLFCLGGGGRECVCFYFFGGREMVFCLVCVCGLNWFGLVCLFFFFCLFGCLVGWSLYFHSLLCVCFLL